MCAKTNLVVSAKTMERTINEFRAQVPTFRRAQNAMESWHNCFVSELETQMFFAILPHRISYIPGTGGICDSLKDALADFPDAIYDADQAGSCFATGNFSACVYHLMRVAEHGLVSVAASLKVDPDKLSKGWDGCIQGIEGAIKTIASTKPTVDWQSEVKKYSDLCSWFTTIKTGWRNPASHIPRVYLEPSASGMFSSTAALVEHLKRYGFKQTTMPNDPLPPPVTP